MTENTLLIFFIVMAVSFICMLILTPHVIPLLKRLKFGQQVREEGNPEHLKKQGTPTMGGLSFLAVVTVVTGISAIWFPRLVPVLLLTLAFGLTGFIDDYIKVVKKRSEGFNPRQKFLMQTVFAIGFALYCYFDPEIGSKVVIPFTGGKLWDMGIFYIPFAVIAIVGTDNGTNFTDGLDGLASSVTAVVALFFMIVFGQENPAMGVFSAAFAGALLGFLVYNGFPALLFMGDTGSLALGGLVAGTAFVMKCGWLILIFGLIYVIEVLSVILQVGYFKMTHGKRLFKMAPIHHHFELCGLSETRIVMLFSGITVLMCMLARLAM